MIGIALAALAVVAPALQTTNSSYPAKLGKPYMIGVVGVDARGKKDMDLQESRLVTLNRVQTATCFGTKLETIVAPEGKKLVIFDATIKNPEKRTIVVGSSKTFGLRVYDTKFTSSDVKYRGACRQDRSAPDATLKPGESIRVFTIYEFPAETPHLRVGIYYYTYIPNQTPKFDLTDAIEKPTSVFAKSNMSYVSAAQAVAGERCDFDSLQVRVLEAARIEGNGVAVRVEFTNPNLLPVGWGWQYATATIWDRQSRETTAYPDFKIDPEFADWGSVIAPGRRIAGAYLFYPTQPGEVQRFRLKMNATQRSLTAVLRS